MRALTFQEPGSVSIDRVDDPALVEPSDVIVRVDLGAICGSDLHVYRGHEQGLDPGTVMGHEFLGEVVETGAETQLAVGEMVVSPFTTSCGRCFYCASGLTARCERGELFGWVEGGVGLHGSQAEYVRVPLADSTLVPVPAALGAESEALFAGDVLSTGLFCADNGGVRPGASVVVLGCGPVGLMSIVGARQLGADRVWAVDGIRERLTLAGGFGAETIDLGGEPVEVVRERTEGRGADVVLEAVGSPAATRLAFELVRPGGTVSAAGVHTETHFAFSPGEAYDKNLTYRAGRCSARAYMEDSLTIAASGKYDLSAIVSHEIALSDAVRGYDLFDRRVEGCTKVLLRPDR